MDITIKKKMSNHPLHNEINNLLKKYHAGIITPQEFASLSEKVHLLPEKELLSYIHEHWDNFNNYEELSDEEIHYIYNVKILPNVNNKYFPKRIREFWMQIAISLFVLLLGGLTVLSYNIYIRNQNYSRFHAVITELDNIKVDTSSQITLITDSSTLIRVNKGAIISYSKKGNLLLDQVAVKTETEKVTYNQLIVPKGKYSHLYLSDGTEIYVNAGTKVVYPNKFVGKKREIYVDGEIALHVKKDKEHPFIVKTSSFGVMVLGTTFNVRSYKNMEKAEVVLAEGIVEVTDIRKSKVKLVPNEMLSIQSGNVISKRNVDANEYMAWTKGRYLMSGKDIECILHELSQYYGIDITYDEEIKSCHLYGTLDLHLPLHRLLDMMSKLIPVKVYKDVNKYHMSIEHKNVN